MRNSDMNIEQRRERIFSMIKDNISMSIKDLSSSIGVSEMTIRRDCNMLSKTGKITQKMGVAYYVSLNTNTDEYMYENKKLIGYEAAKYVSDNDVVFINSSTTAFHAIKKILNKKVSIITNNGNAPSLLSDNDVARVILSGGNTSKNGIMSGDIANHTFLSMRANIGIIGCAGISVDQGISTPKIEEANVNKTIIKHSKKLIVVADHTKFNSFSNFTIGQISDIDILITDTLVDDEILNAFKKLGVIIVQVN